MFEHEVKVKGEYVKGTIKNKRFHGHVVVDTSKHLMAGLTWTQIDNMIYELTKVREQLDKK